MTAFIGQEWTVTLGGVPLTVVPDPAASDGTNDAPTETGTYATQESDLTFRKRDVPVFLRRFTRGAGVLELRDAGDDGGLAWAEDGYTHLGNGLVPSGYRFAKGAGLGLGLSGVAVIDSRIYNGDLWAITTGGYVVRIPNADPTAPFELNPALNAFGNPTTSLRAGYVCKAIEVFATAAGVSALYVSAYNAGTGQTRMYQFVAGVGWTESLAWTIHADQLAVVYWQGRDGVGAQRLCVVADPITVRHCPYGSDPLVEANYVTPIVVGNPAYPITKLLAAPAHLWVGKTNGWHDINEVRTANVTPYWADQPFAPNNGRLVAAIYDHYLMAARGFNSIDAYDTSAGELGLQRLPGEMGPLSGQQDGSPIRGQLTAFAQHDGWFLMALWNPEQLTSYVGRAMSRERLGVDVPSPLVHHWAEQAIKPTAGVGQQITHMTVASPTVVATETVSSRQTNLWMFTADVPTGAGFNLNLYYAGLPVGSGPLSLTASGGTFTYNPTARFYLTAQTWLDRNATKYLRRLDLVGRDLNGGNSVAVYSRADGDPQTITDLATWTLQGTATGLAQSITPAAQLSGRSIALLAILTTASPYHTPPVLHELSARAAVRRETFKVTTLWVVLEQLHELVGGTPDLRLPDAVLDSLVAMQSAGYQTYVDAQNVSSTVLVEQGIRFVNQDLGDGRWRTLCRLELSQVSS